MFQRKLLSFPLNYLSFLSDISRSYPLMLCLRFFLIGLLLPLGFAPFHFPGMSLLSLALLCLELNHCQKKYALQGGFFFGLGAFGVGVSWVYVSIHTYGHLSPFFSAFITLIFIAYLSCFTALFACIYHWLKTPLKPISRVLLFSTLWTLSEYLRSTLFTGFPWLLLGLGQLDSPLGAILPILGVYGTSFVASLAAACLSYALMKSQTRRYYWLMLFLSLLFSPYLLKDRSWTQPIHQPIRVGIIQANISMREKWDDALFWSILETYQTKIKTLLGQDLIVLPESALPVPTHYISDYLDELQDVAQQNDSGLLIGMPSQTHGSEKTFYYNTLITLGKAKGSYTKRHLVPFGEYIPAPFRSITEALGIPDPDLSPGPDIQPPIRVKQLPIASLICYELAYSELLRNQLPQATFIVSVSDDGWFGHSLAMYQQQQIAQVRSLQTGRYQIMANNDGLSAIIDDRGQLVASLPPLSEGTLTSRIHPRIGLTPWMRLGDHSIILSLLVFMLFQNYKPLAQGIRKALSLPVRLNNKR